MENIKQYLKEKQPIVYKTLQNSFKSKKTTHAYIINGSKGAPNLDIAYLMAQSLICENPTDDGLACEQCINCLKVKNNGYADLRIINGESLKNDAVMEIQHEFNKSSLEKENIKIYIINLIEKAPIASLNKLLKFIEEPTSNVVAIFTTNSISSILPTIVSRCQVITLKQFNTTELVNYLKDNDVNNEDAYLICKVSNNAELNLSILSSDYYPRVKEMVGKSLMYLATNDDYFIVYMQVEGLKILEENSCVDLYLDMLEVSLLQTIIKKEDVNTVSEFFNEEISKLANTKHVIYKMIDDITAAKLALISNANKQLVFDKLLISLLGR